MPLPPKYQYLSSEPGPRILLEALALHGIKETPGPRDNPTIIAWATETGIPSSYTSDMTPWCGLFLAVVAHRAGYASSVPATPLWARSWTTFGNSVPIAHAALGDVLVFTRPGGGGHVGIYVGEDPSYFHIIGGNQNDAVSITRISKRRCIAARRCPWSVAQPKNVRKIHLDANGPISTNER